MSESIFSTKYLEPAIYLLIGWLFSEIISFYKEKNTNQSQSTKENTNAIIALDKTLIEIRGQITLLSTQIQPLMRLPTDIAEAHSKIREIKASISKSKEF